MNQRNDKIQHPGEIMFRHFMAPEGISINKLAREIKVPPNRICAIVNGERGITADTAMRLARYFGTTAKFWMHLQSRYDLDIMPEDIAAEIEREITPLPESRPAAGAR